MSIAVDLDGTLAYYEHWKGIDDIGAPVAPMLARVKKWVAAGVEVVIFTARLDRPESNAAAFHIREWLRKNGLPGDLRITNVKTRDMALFFDDRAYHVIPNTGELNLVQQEIDTDIAPIIRSLGEVQESQF